MPHWQAHKQGLDAFRAGGDRLPSALKFFSSALAETFASGAMSRGDLREALQSQVERSVAAGATLLAGGQPKAGNGYFFEPTVVANAGPGKGR